MNDTVKQLESSLSLYKSKEGYERIMAWYDSVRAKITVPVESVWVSTRHGRTHMLAAGNPDAEPLLLFPGVAGSAPLFHRAIAPLSKQFRVYAVDIVGQPGLSDPIPPSFLNKSFVAWVGDVLDGLGYESAHLAGQSAGGGIVLQVGIETPERARSVIMFGPTGMARSRLPVKIWLTKVVSRRDENALEEDLTAKSIRPQRTGESFGTYDRDLARLMALATRHFRVDRSVGVYDHETGKVDLIKGFKVLKKFFFAEPKSWLARLKVPSLLIYGEHELFYNPHKITDRIRKIIPGIQTAVFPNAGHGAIYDQPTKVAEMVCEFVSQLDRPKSIRPEESRDDHAA